jgi:hypothetical protein
MVTQNNVSEKCSFYLETIRTAIYKTWYKYQHQNENWKLTIQIKQKV